MRIDLSGKNALVTGASQGLGEVILRRLHDAGANVILNFLAEADNASRAQEIVAELGNNATAVAADVRELESLEIALDATVARLGNLDIVVNNAGIIRDRSFAKMNSDEWQQVIDTNLTGIFNVCKATSNAMNRHGRIVNLSSLSAVTGPFGQANYAAAKGGVISLTKVLSREFAKRGVTVNAVAPGVVLTEMGKSIPNEIQASMLSQIPLARFGTPAEIADVVVFLCSDLASYVNGQTIHVNGGWWSP